MIKIKILYLTILYNEKGNNLYNDLVNELVSNGHQITIVRSNTTSKLTLENLSDSINILNVKTGDFFANNLIGKGISTLFIGFFFKMSIKKHLYRNQYDIVLYATPPITFNSVVKYCKRKFNCKSFLMLKDIFPQNAVDLQMFSKSSPIHHFFRRKEKKLYNTSDCIGCMSKGNIEYLIRNNNYLDENKVILFPNSIKIKDEVIYPSEKEWTYFIFGGNLGKPQYIDGIIQIVESLKNFSDAKFVICGDGTEKRVILDYLSKTNCSKNLEYYETLPQDKYNDILNQADIGLISLNPKFTIPNIPSKMQNYMLLKKPIFAFVDNHTDLPTIIDQANCGWYSLSDNIEKSCEMIKLICKDKELQKEKGLNGFCYLKDNYDVTYNVKILEEFMEEE